MLVNAMYMPQKPTINSLSDFVKLEMKRRDISSAREFARFVGISYELVNQMLKGSGAKYPKIETLLKLAEATGTDVVSLFLLVLPDNARRANPEDLILSQRIQQLSPEFRKMIDVFVHSSTLQGLGKSDEKK